MVSVGYEREAGRPRPSARRAPCAWRTVARIALVNRAARAEIETVVRGVEKIETAVEPRFQEHFVEAMALPHKTHPFPNLAEVVALPAPKPGTETGVDDNGRRRRRRRG